MNALGAVLLTIGIIALVCAVAVNVLTCHPQVATEQSLTQPYSGRVRALGIGGLLSTILGCMFIVLF